MQYQIQNTSMLFTVCTRYRVLASQQSISKYLLKERIPAKTMLCTMCGSLCYRKKTVTVNQTQIFYSELLQLSNIYSPSLKFLALVIYYTGCTYNLETGDSICFYNLILCWVALWQCICISPCQRLAANLYLVSIFETELILCHSV